MNSIIKTPTTGRDAFACGDVGDIESLLLGAALTQSYVEPADITAPAAKACLSCGTVGAGHTDRCFYWGKVFGAERLSPVAALLPNVGDMVSYRDWPEQADSFLRRGIVTEVTSTDARDVLTLRHPEKPEITWIEWFNAEMQITPAAA